LNIYVRLVYRNLRANLDKLSLFFELIFPLFFVFIEGFGLGGIVPPISIGGGQTISYPLFLAGGAVTLTAINGGTNAGTQLWFDRKNGMFEQILMGPFSRAEYIFSIIIATLIIGVASSLFVFLLALPVLGVGLSLSLGGALLVAAALFLGTVFFGSFAIALSVVLRSSESFQIVSQFAFFIFLFTSSVFYLPSKAPPILAQISLLNPLTYITDMFRAGIFNAIDPLVITEAIVMAAEALAMIAIAIVAFRRIRV